MSVRGGCDKPSVSGFILKIEPLGFAVDQMWDEREKRAEND